MLHNVWHLGGGGHGPLGPLNPPLANSSHGYLSMSHCLLRIESRLRTSAGEGRGMAQCGQGGVCTYPMWMTPYNVFLERT